MPHNSNSYTLQEFINYLLNLYADKLTSATGSVIEIVTEYSYANTPELKLSIGNYKVFGALIRIQSIYKSSAQCSFQINMPNNRILIIGCVSEGVLVNEKIYN